MSSFPLIEKYLPNLNLHGNSVLVRHVIYPEDLEAELAKGVVVYGENTSPDGHDKQVRFLDSERRTTFDTHQGLLIGYQLVEEKPVSKDEVLKLLKDYKVSDIPEFRDLVKRLEKQESL